LEKQKIFASAQKRIRSRREILRKFSAELPSSCSNMPAIFHASAFTLRQLNTAGEHSAPAATTLW
jgi:hypothetical protein